MGTTYSGKRRQSTSLDYDLRSLASQEEEIEARLRAEMEHKLLQKLERFEAERHSTQDARYEDLMCKFNTLLSQFDRM
jgi:hypothetical protein